MFAWLALIECAIYILSNGLFLFQVIILWTANTERFCDVREGLNDTAESLLRSIAHDEDEVSPSTIFAVASILEKVTFYFPCKFCRDTNTQFCTEIMSKILNENPRQK